MGIISCYVHAHYAPDRFMHKNDKSCTNEDTLLMLASGCAPFLYPHSHRPSLLQIWRPLLASCSLAGPAEPLFVIVPEH
jgi:hypothetical protein